MTNEFFVFVSALHSANAFQYALSLDVDLTEKTVVVFVQTK